MSQSSHQSAVYVVDGARSPFLKATAQQGPFSACDMAVQVGSSLLNRQSFARTDVDQVILGCMMPGPDEANIGRLQSVRLQLGERTPGWTVQRNCGSGMQALDCAFQDIRSGRANLVMAGGVDVMSRAPLLWRSDLVNWFLKLNRSRGLGNKFKQFLQLKLRDLNPIIALKQGLNDPLINLNMGQTIEEMVYRFGIMRSDLDRYALLSHERAAHAVDNDWFNEIIPIFDDRGQCYDHDTGLRRETSLEKLTALKPYIEPPYGIVTAGNSSQITDGAAWLILASKEAVKRYQLPILGEIVDVQWQALDPLLMGLGPVVASDALLKQHNLKYSDINYWEINEAFSGQVLSCMRVLGDPEFCQTYLGTDTPPGPIDINRLNVDGGAIALGHPVGASGARIVLHLLHVLQREQAERGIASLCIGGGQGGAMLLQRVDS